MLQARYNNGLSLWHPGDQTMEMIEEPQQPPALVEESTYDDVEDE